MHWASGIVSVQYGIFPARIWIKGNLEVPIGNEAAADVQVSFSIRAAMKGGDRHALSVGQSANDEPPLQAVAIRHNIFVSMTNGTGASAERLVAGMHWLSPIGKLF